MKGLRQAAKTILRAKTTAISCHINPDGDSIGSLLALGLGLERLGKRVYMLSPDGVPKRYVTLPGAGKILARTKKAVDLAIAVDCSNKEILGESYNVFKRSRDILEIDHHDFRRPFGNIFLIDGKAAAVGELIYLLLGVLGVPVTEDIAQNLLTSIVVETDSFRLPNVRPFTFEVCNQLMRKGTDFYKLVDTIFWSKTRASIILSGLSLARCKFLKNNRLAWSIIRKKDFLSVRGKYEDVDAVADQMRSIQGVEVVVFFREQNKRFLRVSLRSKGKINIAAIAEDYNGGGHFDVAGCTIANNSAAIKQILNKAENLLN